MKYRYFLTCVKRYICVTLTFCLLLQQGKFYDALKDNVFVTLCEQMNGKPDDAGREATDRLSKIVAAKQTAKHMAKMARNELNMLPPVSPYPPKSYCKQFFESFPAYYRWKVTYASTDR